MARVRHAAQESPQRVARRDLEGERTALAELAGYLDKATFGGLTNTARWEVVRRCCIVALRCARWILTEIDDREG